MLMLLARMSVLYLKVEVNRMSKDQPYSTNALLGV